MKDGIYFKNGVRPNPGYNPAAVKYHFYRCKATGVVNNCDGSFEMVIRTQFDAQRAVGTFMTQLQFMCFFATTITITNED